MNKANNPVRAIETTISVLKSVKELEGNTLGEIADGVNMTKGTVHNHLTPTEEHGFVVRENDEFHLGIRFFEFGEATRQRRKICEVGTSEVNKLAEQTGELGSLLV